MSVGEAAKMLVDAQRTRRAFAVPQNRDLEGEQQAYQVQDAVFGQLWPGAKPAAWKVGGPSDKVEPTAAPIPSENLLRSPASVQASRRNFLGVEAEVAFRLARDLPARGRPYSGGEVAAAIGELLVTVELCDTRLAGWKDAPALWKLADFGNNGALVIGSGTAKWRELDFAKQEVVFSIGARTRRAQGGHSFGNPFRLMPWIAVHAAQRGMPLRAGDVVTTGAWTGLEAAQAGDEVTARFAGIGEAKVRIN